MSRPVSPDYSPRFVVGLSVAQLITWGSVFYTFALLLEPVERELGMTRAQSSLAFSLALLAEGACAYAVGRWIDRGHERLVMSLGSVVIGIGLVLHSLVAGVASFYAIWILLGAGMAATLYSPVFAVLTRRYPQSFRRAIITLTFLGGLASTVFIPLSAWLIQSLGWHQALWVLAALQFAVCLPLHALLLRHAPAGRRPSSASTQARDEGIATTTEAGVAALLRSPAFLFIGVFVMGMMAVTAALPPHMISLLREAGLPEAWVIIIPASIGAIQVLGRVLLFFFEHRFDVHVANRLIPCLIPLGLGALIAGAGHPAGGLLFVTLYGLGNGMITIVKGTAIAQYVSREHVASLNGALGLPSALARALAPLALGLMWTPGAGYRSGLWMLLVIGVVAALALWGAQRNALRGASRAD